jgi:hypothetical protein
MSAASLPSTPARDTAMGRDDVDVLFEHGEVIGAHIGCLLF